MRRMRDYALRVGLVGITLGVLWFGVYHFKKSPSEDQESASSSSQSNLIKPSSLAKPQSPAQKKQSELASEEKENPSAPEKEFGPIVQKAEAGFCGTVEYLGQGPLKTVVLRSEWEQVMAHFHVVKVDLQKWLKEHREDFSTVAYEAMETKIKSLRIQRPPAKEEPDLAWRGIATLTEGEGGVAVVRLGGGFVKMILKQPKRGRFELARVASQVWAPCELAKSKIENPWNAYLKCMGMEEQGNCTAGSYSESGWAVSTALAARVAQPGCKVAAFSDPIGETCLRNLPMVPAHAALRGEKVMHANN